MILIENVKETYKDLDDVLEQLEEHIQQNIIKVTNIFNIFLFIIIKNFIIYCIYSYRPETNIISKLLAFRKDQHCHPYYVAFIMELWKDQNSNL